MKITSSKIFEKNADIFACKNSSISDIKNFIDLLKNNIELNKIKRNDNLFNKLQYTKNGNYIFAEHPHNTTRIKYLENEINKKLALENK